MGFIDLLDGNEFYVEKTWLKPNEIANALKDAITITTVFECLMWTNMFKIYISYILICAIYQHVAYIYFTVIISYNIHITTNKCLV